MTLRTPEQHERPYSLLVPSYPDRDPYRIVLAGEASLALNDKKCRALCVGDQRCGSAIYVEGIYYASFFGGGKRVEAYPKAVSSYTMPDLSGRPGCLVWLV